MLLLAASCAFAAGSAARAGEQYAILVGVQKYTSTSGLRELAFPERDVEQLADVLTANGWKAGHVTLLTQKKALTENDLRHYPSRENIQQELAGRLELLEPEDSLIVGFAGHGVQFRDDESYFCPADANIDDRATLISLKSIYATLESCPARFKVLLSDACRNTPISAVTRAATVEVKSISRPQEVTPPGGVAALFGCSPGEFAYEDETLQHGVFFHYVIEGLGGAADLDDDRAVDLLELTKYTQSQVKHFVFTKFDRARQIPHFVGSTRGTLPLVTLPAKPTPPQLPDLKVGDAVAVIADESPIQNETAVVARARRGDRFYVLDRQDSWLSVRVPSGNNPLGWIRQHDVRKETVPPARHDLFVKWKNQWWPATVLRVDGDRFRIHYYGHDSSWDEWVGSDRITRTDRKFEPYDILVKWNDGYFWPAKILQQDGGKYFVHYSGSNHTWDEWVTADKVRSLETNRAYHDKINAELAQQ